MTTVATEPVIAPRSGAWLADPGFGIYVHIPFCRHRCHYCDFNTYEGLDGSHSDYVNALVTEIGALDGGSAPVTSIFFGGGTPTLLESDALAAILDTIKARFEVVPDAEITVEANPETVDRAYFERLRERGFNRVSLGVQSTVPRVLQALGRQHSPERALTAIAEARAAGFEDVNADLIYGSPWESIDDWRKSLDDVVAAGPDHISAYALTVEEGTPLHTLVATNRVPDVDPDVQAERHGMADAVLGSAGYDRYEISNWARPGRASRHNVLYWSAGNYIGLGAGAHSHIDGRRSWRVRLPRDYIQRARAGMTTVAGDEKRDPDARAGEALMLGLRLTSGVDENAFVRRFGAAPIETRKKQLRSLESQGSIVMAGGRIALSASGTLVAHDVICRLL